MGAKDLSVFPFWEYLTKDEKEEIQRQSRVVNFTKDQLIASTELDCLGILYVLKGTLRIYLYSEDGREVTIARLKTDEMCLLSASCLLSQVSFPAAVSAEDDVEAILIPSMLANRLKENNIYVENFIYKVTTERLSEVISAVEQMMFMSLEQRVVTFLLDETSENGNNILNITQEKLAMAIGSAREAVSRILKQLVNEGSIEVTRGKIKILDKKMLYSKV